VSIDDSESKKDEVWATLCQAEGWVCRVCGSVPERGQRFTDKLCEDCTQDRSERVGPQPGCWSLAVDNPRHALGQYPATETIPIGYDSYTEKPQEAAALGWENC
jgi:hypothetical protein